MENTLEILKRASERFLRKSDGSVVEDIYEQHQDERMEFYEDALRNKTPFSVVFSVLQDDGTMVCHGEGGVRIVLPGNPNRRGQTFSGRLNQSYNVLVKKIDTRNNEVCVALANMFSESERTQVMREIKQMLAHVTKDIEAEYTEQIKSEQDSAFEQHCTKLDMDKDADQIERILESAKDRFIGNIIEERIKKAYEKIKHGENLTLEEEQYYNLILPARIFAIRPNGNDSVCAAIDILGMYINGIIYPRHWVDRYSSGNIFRSELDSLIGSAINVAIIGFNAKRNEFVCSHRILQSSVWDNIENYFKEGDILQVRCVRKLENRYYGRIVGKIGDSEDAVEEFRRIEIIGQYPSSNNAIMHNVTVKEGGIYQCKISRIDKDKKLLIAKTIRDSGKWV